MAGTKTWADGDVLTAVDLNGFVRDQWITVCTSGTRPTTTQEGRTIHETDTDRYYRWDGAAWEHILGPPVWTAVTFGSPFADWGGAAQATQYTKVGGEVRLRGLVKATGAATDGTMFTLPAGFRPAADQHFAAVKGSLAACGIVVFTTGVVVWAGTVANNDNLYGLPAVRFNTA